MAAVDPAGAARAPAPPPVAPLPVIGPEGTGTPLDRVGSSDSEGNAGEQLMVAQAITRAGRSQPQETWSSPACEPLFAYIAPIPARSYWMWTRT